MSKLPEMKNYMSVTLVLLIKSTLFNKMVPPLHELKCNVSLILNIPGSPIIGINHGERLGTVSLTKFGSE